MNKFFPNLNDELVNKIMDLAEQRTSAENNRYPEGIRFGKTEILPPTQPSQMLKDAIDQLPESVSQDLCALMYFGRDGLENQSVGEAVTGLRVDASKRADAENKRSLREKVQLADYLNQGKQLLLQG